MPVGFLAFGFLMLLAAAALLFFPANRDRRGLPVVPALGAVALPLAAIALYGAWSEWPWPEPDVETERLAAAARATPDDPDPWLQLGLRQVEQGQLEQALTALDRAYELNAGRDADTAIRIIETLSALGVVPPQRLGELLDEVLTRHPNHPQAQWYAAEVAFARGEFARAARLWRALLARANADDRPEAKAVRDILARRIEQADNHQTAEQPAATSSTLRVTVRRDSSLDVTVPGETPLFVLARAQDAPGPPLAVKRRKVADLPLTLELSDADAMLPNRRLSGHDEVEIIARIALGGGPVAQSGDPFGSVRVERASTDTVTVVIDQVTP